MSNLTDLDGVRFDCDHLRIMGIGEIFVILYCLGGTGWDMLLGAGSRLD